MTVIGATNRPDDLDPAVLRRFEKRVEVPLPAEAERVQLLRLYADELPHALTDADFATLATASAGYSGADLVSACE